MPKTSPDGRFRYVKVRGGVGNNSVLILVLVPESFPTNSSSAASRSVYSPIGDNGPSTGGATRVAGWRNVMRGRLQSFPLVANRSAVETRAHARERESINSDECCVCMHINQCSISALFFSLFVSRRAVEGVEAQPMTRRMACWSAGTS